MGQEVKFERSTHRVATRDEDGFVMIQPDPNGSQGTLGNYETFLPFGIMARPKDPTDGTGAEIIVASHGQDNRVLLFHDPRWMSALPDFGEGGMALYATTEKAGARVAPYIAFFGAKGSADEGTFRIHVPAGSGEAKIEIDPNTGDITITHPLGVTVKITSAGVELGGTGAVALVKAPMLEAWTALVSTALSGLGAPVPTLSGSGTTKVTGL